MFADFGNLFFIVDIFDNFINPGGDFDHVNFFHATTGEGRGSETDAGWIPGFGGVSGNGVFIDDDVSFFKSGGSLVAG